MKFRACDTVASGSQLFVKSTKLRPVSSRLSPLFRLQPTHQHPFLHRPPSIVFLILFPAQDFPSYWHPGSPPACQYVVKHFPEVLATHCGSYSKTSPYNQILTFSTLAPFSLSPCPETTPNPSTTTPQLTIIALVTGGNRFRRRWTNRNSHKMHESCSSIWPLASKIFTHPAVSFPTGMQPPRHRPNTTIGGKPSLCGR